MGELTSDQSLQLTMLFAQQDILNQVVVKYLENLAKERPMLEQNNMDALARLLKTVVDDVNEKQFQIDTQIKQIQNDIRAKLN